MKVLLDHCVPRSFGRLLPGHVVRTTALMKWDRLKNGDLLAAAAKEFDVMLTVDANLRSQQDLGNFPLPVVAFVANSNAIEDLAPLAPETQSLLNSKLQNRVYIVGPYRVPRPGTR